ncbi:unnamed protein product [Schistosoma mattheei]|uniref:Uncharacterized protein n=1 Tax=Schistosoma mattheei TaxID=31246 RepID=A0A183NG77_9TREM|nr:unnamed protein product [Schistosoma mattheei]
MINPIETNYFIFPFFFFSLKGYKPKNVLSADTQTD